MEWMIRTTKHTVAQSFHLEEHRPKNTTTKATAHRNVRCRTQHNWAPNRTEHTDNIRLATSPKRSGSDAAQMDTSQAANW